MSETKDQLKLKDSEILKEAWGDGWHDDNVRKDEIFLFDPLVVGKVFKKKELNHKEIDMFIWICWSIVIACSIFTIVMTVKTAKINKETERINADTLRTMEETNITIKKTIATMEETERINKETAELS